tara:strand:+ start:172 stop:534 length:363 start_codon:yes stop_codon:yes gene_type:complete
MQENEKTIYRGDTNEEQEEILKNPLANSESEYEVGKHPNSIKAIAKHQFKKGTSGNPLGKPTTLSTLKKSLDSIAEQEVTNYHDEVLGTRKEIVIKRIWTDAQNGDWKKIQLLAVLGCLD